MTEERIETVKSIYDEVYGRIMQVYDVFKDYYGEDMVDCTCPTLGSVIQWVEGRENTTRSRLIEYLLTYLRQGNYSDAALIYVRWPKVRITNEYDKYVDITELFARVIVDMEGKIKRRFDLTRTEYNAIQWTSGYVHSHVPAFNPANINPPGFNRPCTGSGPINATIDTLQHAPTNEIWGLFVYELDKYVTVESIAGTPHFRMANIGSRSSYIDLSQNLPVDYIRNYTFYVRSGRYDGIRREQLTEFVKYFLGKKCMKFSYSNGCWGLGETFLEFWIRVSNCFIEWYNQMYREKKLRCSLEDLKKANIIKEYLVAENKVYSLDYQNVMQSTQRAEGHDMFMFKGKMLKLHITDVGSEDSVTRSILIDRDVCRAILTKVFKLINSTYGREEGTGEAQGEGTSPSQSCYFI